MGVKRVISLLRGEHRLRVFESMLLKRIVVQNCIECWSSRNIHTIKSHYLIFPFKYISFNYYFFHIVATCFNQKRNEYPWFVPVQSVEDLEVQMNYQKWCLFSLLYVCYSVLFIWSRSFLFLCKCCVKLHQWRIVSYKICI